LGRRIRSDKGAANVLDGEKVLITGATGKIAFPIARALA
jgi:UDP-glucuronate 4-epimerase